uniref:tRNA (adenine(58)-N(1))-methyltransferase n=1 Tax=Caenorhabditis japonica TaxID=281687 RepID=A0A8R1DHU7_CAEJA
MTLATKGPSFLKYNERIEEGDTVIVYVTFGQMIPTVVKRGQTLMMKYGALRHEFIIGKRWGQCLSASAGFVYILRPTSDLWTRSLPRRTQILYTADCAEIIALLDCKPGSVICESGTGSGSLSHAIALAVAPNGHLYTHDIDESRTKKVQEEFKTHGLSEITTPVVQNVCTDGFFVTNACDGVFLDVPAPWDAIPHAARALSRSRGGRIVSFSPCMEQVQRACLAMSAAGFVCVETIEVVPEQKKIVGQHRQTLEEFEELGDAYPKMAKKRDSDGKVVGFTQLVPHANSSAAVPEVAPEGLIVDEDFDRIRDVVGPSFRNQHDRVVVLIP